METTNSMYSVLNPMFFVSKLLGLAPFNVTSQEATDSLPATIWKQYNSIMLSVGDNMSVFMDVFGMGLSILCGVFFRNRVVEAINELSFIDKEFKTFNYVSDLQKMYKKNQKVVTFLTTFLTLYFLTYIIVNTCTYFHTFSLVFVGDVIAYVCPTITNGLIEMQFCVLIILIKKRLCWLNNQMNQVGEILWKSNFSNQNPMMIIMKTKYFHKKLCDISETVNKAYSFQLLFMLMALFLNTIMTLFYWAIQSVPTNRTEILVADVIYMNNKFVFGVLQVLVLVYVCSSTTQEAKKTGTLIHDIMPPSNVLQHREAIQIQLSCFSLQLANRNIQFSACGVFLINETLIYSIIGAASAYLVIVIQFELTSSTTGASKNHTASG
ncbi:hypothetical protein FQR65_LT05546 [Abscondita terminalis]|nr:hypothetical protein FQR65_LT05546 [Abscondita terminalis]